MRREPRLLEILRAICAKAGLRIIREHPLSWTQEYRTRWQQTFGGPHSDWKRARFEWEVLGTEEAPAFERRAAIREFEKQRMNVRRAFVALSLDRSHVAEVEGMLPAYEWWQQAIAGQELFIVDDGWDWSFVITHETAMGIGPFFVVSHETD